MPGERKNRKRHNTIAFWLDDEEKAKVEARIILSGLQKGEYYRRSILGQEVQITAGHYMSERVAASMEKLADELAKASEGTEKEFLVSLSMEVVLQTLIEFFSNIPDEYPGDEEMERLTEKEKDWRQKLKAQRETE